MTLKEEKFERGHYKDSRGYNNNSLLFSSSVIHSFHYIVNHGNSGPNDKLSEKLVVEKRTIVKSQKVLILLTTTTTTTVGRIETVKAKSYDTTLYCWQKQPVCTAFFRFTFISFRSLLCSTVLIVHSTFSERRRTIRNIYIQYM